MIAMANTKDMTIGSPAKLIASFALPLMLGNVFQQMYTMVDTMVVGQGVGVEALASLGAADALRTEFWSLKFERTPTQRSTFAYTMRGNRSPFYDFGTMFDSACTQTPGYTGQCNGRRNYIFDNCICLHSRYHSV